MRKYTGENRNSPILKIVLFTVILTVILALAVKFLNISSLIFRGPTTVVNLITDSGLKNTNNRINILVLGIGGTGHDGPNLSDTMILASIDKNGKDTTIISIPRDLWAPTISSKINAAYAFGQEKDGQGLDLSKETVSNLFGVPIHYALRVDFNGFVKAIDMLGGLDIEIDKTFSDYRYPIEGKETETCGLEIETKVENGTQNIYFKDSTGSATLLTEDNDPFTCRYESLTFKQGPTHMDGATVLKYVRSRHGTNDENSDFARSARQQKVILAMRQKVVSTQTLLSPATIIDLIKTFSDSIDTDIKNEDIPLFVKLEQKIDPAAIRRIVLDAGRDESVLDVGNPSNYGGQYVLDPKGDNWTELAEYLQGEIFKLPNKE